MTKPQIIKLVGTVLAFVAGGGGAAFLPPPYGHLAVDVALVLLSWLHLMPPDAAKVSP